MKKENHPENAMKCDTVITLLQPFMDQVLTSDVTESINQHLETCSSCRNELQVQKKLINHLSFIPPPSIPEDQWQSIHDNVLSALPGIDQNRATLNMFSKRKKHFFFHMIGTAAALLAISIVSFTLVFKHNNSSQAVATSETNIYPHLTNVHGNVYASSERINNHFSMRPGNTITTDSAAGATVTINEKTHLTLGSSTNCMVKNCSEQKMVFALHNGNLKAIVNKQKSGNLFRIETPNAFCEVIGTRFDVTTNKADEQNRHVTTLTVHEGVVRFGTDLNNVLVKAGNGIALLGDSLSTEFKIDDPLLALATSGQNKGLLELSSNPENATVYIDNNAIGSTPLTSILTQGDHTLRVEKSGCLPWSTTVSIQPIQKTIRIVSLSNIIKTKPVQKNTSFSNKHSDTPEDNPHFRSALIQMSKGSYKQAISTLHHLMQKPDISAHLEAAAYQKLGICYKNSGNVESAFIVQNKIINGTYPSQFKSNALFERATLYRTTFHDVTSAIKDFTQYLKENRNGLWVEEATLSLAQLLQTSGDYKQSALHFEQFCSKYKHSSHYEKALYTLATIYYAHISDCGRAIKAFNQLLHNNTASEYAEDASFWSADCQLRLGHPSRAREAFNLYLKQYPTGKWVAEAENRIHTIQSVEVQ